MFSKKTISDEFLTNQDRFLCLINNEHKDESKKFNELYSVNMSEELEFKATLLENLVMNFFY